MVVMVYIVCYSGSGRAHVVVVEQHPVLAYNIIDTTVTSLTIIKLTR